jgi:hypothetical protein
MPTGASTSTIKADPISDFFASLAAPGHIETFAGQSAKLRFDILNGGRPEMWYLTVADGDVTVSRQDAPADAVVRVHRPDFEAMVSGRLNAQAAMLRGLLTCEGSMAAVIMFQRCLPSPPGSTGRVPRISSKTVTEQRRGQ